MRDCIVYNMCHDTQRYHRVFAKKRFSLACLAGIFALELNKMKKFSVFQALMLFFIIPLGLAAQSGDFSPFVSQIRAESRSISTESRNNLIRLTWKDSPDVQGPVYIFRSARPFTGSIPANIRPVIVRYGIQYYLDETDGMENIYYFIAASDTSGGRYDIIIPQTNSINVNTSQSQMPVVLTPPVTADIEQIEGISNLRARQDGERVIITFDTAHPHKDAVLYRSMQPVGQPQDLLNAFFVQTGVVSPFVDFPVPGFTWYYAVIYEDEILTGNVRIMPGINATTYGGQTAERPMRPIPLPILTLNNPMTGGFLPDTLQQGQLSAGSMNMLRNTEIPNRVSPVLKKPRVFTVDLQFPAGGEESALFQIIKDHFQRFEWESALVGLQDYLSLPRSADVESRARFYLGQTLYFTGNYRGALMEFLFFRSFNPVEASSWIEAVLTAMVYLK